MRYFELNFRANFKRYGLTGLLSGVLVAAILFFGAGKGQAAIDNPYPTLVIADYVFGCMASNGQTRQAMEHCSCSVDVISTIVSYENYEKAETVLSLRRLSGEKSAVFKTAARFKNVVDVLRQAQAEAEVRCF